MRQIAKSFGIELVGLRLPSAIKAPYQRQQVLSRFTAVGDPPYLQAMLVAPGHVVVHERPLPLGRVDAVLHEICHGVVGAPIGMCELESGLLALQYALIGELADHPRLHAAALDDFDNYCVGTYDDIGSMRDDGIDFRTLGCWRRGVEVAKRKKLLHHDGAVNWDAMRRPRRRRPA